MLDRASTLYQEGGITSLFSGIGRFFLWRWYNFINNIYMLYVNQKYDMYDLTEEDWDNLIILDACRYDVFVELIGNDVNYRYSNGTKTPEWLIQNFDGKKSEDTVYVTANPQYMIKRKEGRLDTKFHDIIPVWKYEWNHNYGTVLPEDMIKHVKDANKQYPHKRLLIHFNQPHFPPIGESREELDAVNISNSWRMYYQASGKEPPDFSDIWQLMKNGNLSKDLAWGLYRENLEIVYPYVEELADTLPGKTVVTSDHGNLFGERRLKIRKFRPTYRKEYGHDYVYCEELLKVPWHEFNYDERKKIVAGDSFDDDIEYDEETVVKKLSDLGYK